jgi:hypothetical protein
LKFGYCFRISRLEGEYFLVTKTSVSKHGMKSNGVVKYEDTSFSWTHIKRAD